jgi:hypothetical protein
MDLLIDVLGAVLLAMGARELSIGRGRAPELREDGTVVLRPGLIFKVVGWGSLAFAGLIVILAVKTGPLDSDERAIFLTMLGAFGAGGLYLLKVARSKYIELSPLGIAEHTTFGHTRRVFWREVTIVRFSAVMKEIQVQDPHSVVRIDVGTTGISHFWNVVEANLPEDLWTEGRQAFGAYVGTQNVKPSEVQ